MPKPTSMMKAQRKPPASASDLSEGEIQESRSPSRVTSGSVPPMKEDDEVPGSRTGSPPLSLPLATRNALIVSGMEVDEEDLRIPEAELAQVGANQVNAAPNGGAQTGQPSSFLWNMTTAVAPAIPQITIESVYPMEGKVSNCIFSVDAALATNVAKWCIGSSQVEEKEITPARIILACIKRGNDEKGEDTKVFVDASWAEVDVAVRVNKKQWNRLDQVETSGPLDVSPYIVEGINEIEVVHFAEAPSVVVCLKVLKIQAEELQRKRMQLRFRELLKSSAFVRSTRAS